MGYAEEVMADNPLIYLKLGEASGWPQNTGSLGGAVNANGNMVYEPVGIAGSLDGCYRSAAVNPTYMTLPNISSTHWDGSYSVEIWFKLLGETDKTLVWFKNQPYWYFNTNNAGQLSFTADDNQSSTITIATSGSVLNNSNWQHAVAVIDAGTIKMYLNGSLVATKTQTPGTYSVTGAVEIGDSRTQFSSTYGWYDEVAMYPTGLSAARVLAHYNAGITTPPVSFRGWGVPL